MKRGADHGVLLPCWKSPPTIEPAARRIWDCSQAVSRSPSQPRNVVSCMVGRDVLLIRPVWLMGREWRWCWRASEFAKLYEDMGRESIPPEWLLRASLLQAF